jgi:tetratricopeptide (TPR) repeat protein
MPDTEPRGDAGAQPRADHGFGRTLPAEEFSASGVSEIPAVVVPLDDDAPLALAGVEVWARLGRPDPASPTRNAERYEGARLLGVGSTGVVYSIHDRSLRRRIAVKVLKREAASADGGLASFIEEAQLTAALKHPNVLPVLDIDVTAAGQPFFSMNQIEGRTLGDLLLESSTGRRHEAIAGLNQVISIIIAVCNAVAYAHHQRIVHQDIKPENILIGGFGEVLVLDWGCAARLDGGQRRIYGTPLYMSPEQARRERVDELSDLYCIGATLFHALLLRPPIWRDDPEAFWTAKKEGRIDAPTHEEISATPAALLGIALKAMAAEPARRYASVEELRRDLERYQAGQAVTAYREPAWRRFRRWYAANVLLFWTAAIAVAAVASGTSYAVYTKLMERPAWTMALNEHFDGGSLAALTPLWGVRSQQVFRWPASPMAEGSVDNPAMFALTDGGVRLIAHDAHVVDLYYRPGVAGDIRIEWTVRPLESTQNLNCFIGGPDRLSGFTVHVAGFGDTRLVALTLGEGRALVHARMREPMRLGRDYRFALERDDRHLRFAIDGETFIDYVDVDSVVSATLQQFGFDTYPENSYLIRDVTVQRRVPGKRVSPLEVADRLFQFRHWEEAELQYRGILSAYPDTDLAVAAEYRVARCEHELGHDAEAKRLFDAFIEHHRTSELAPLALTARLYQALDEHDAATADRLRHQLTGFPGNPVLLQVLMDLARERLPALAESPRIGIVQPAYPPDIEQRIERELATMHGWYEAYGMPRDDDLVHERALSVLNDLGRHPRALAECLNDQERQDCLIDMGRYEEAVRLPDGTGRLYAVARLDLERYDEVAADPSAPAEQRGFAAFLRGDDPDGIRRFDPDSRFAWVQTLQDGRYDEFLRAHPTEERGPNFGDSMRVEALLASGHADQVLAEYLHGSATGRALMALGRLDEAERTGSWDAGLLMCIALRRFEQGDVARGMAIVESLLGVSLLPVGHEVPTVFLPAMVLAANGDRARAEARLRGVVQRDRDVVGQRPWYSAAYALGEIDDAKFLAQPAHALVQARLLFAQGMRAELSGDAGAAAERYRALLALPYHRSLVTEEERAFMEWRLRARGIEPPRGLSLPLSQL